MRTADNPLVQRLFRAIDVALGLAIFAFGTYEAIAHVVRGGVAPNVVFAAAFGALVLRRRALDGRVAGALWSAIAMVQALFLATTHETEVGWLAFLFVAYAVGRWSDPRAATGGIALLVAGMLGVYAVSTDSVPGDFFYPEVIGIVVWAAGRTLRGRARLTEQLHELAVQAEERAERDAARAQVDERRRLAQEMHDVIAHSLSLIVVQAGGARRILAQDPGRAAAAAALIERTGRETLGELRQLLGVLGTELNSTDAPAPTLGRLEALVASADAAGLTVTLEKTGDELADPLPGGVDLAAYRIVQEALTNALRHAGPVAATVSVHRSGGRLELEVTNAPGAATAASLGSAGHGLVGMTERTNLYGGTLETGPLPGGGFRVAATLRYDRSEVAA